MSLLDLVIPAGVAMALLMVVLWAIQRRTGNASIVDPAWALGTGACAAWFALAGSGESAERRWLVAGMGLVWATRLGMLMLRRAAIEGEDGRYRYLREKFDSRIDAFHALFFQVQGGWAILWALPLWAAASADGPLGWRDGLGVLIWLIAMAGEWTADRQLTRFRATAGATGVCDTGLWAWCRHPNYFFEWLHWFAYAVIAATSAWWWVALAGPVMVYLFVVHVTGIPWTEQQALRTRAEAYRQYQRTTPAFFPRVPRGAANLAESAR